MISSYRKIEIKTNNRTSNTCLEYFVNHSAFLKEKNGIFEIIKKSKAVHKEL